MLNVLLIIFNIYVYIFAGGYQYVVGWGEGGFDYKTSIRLLITRLVDVVGGGEDCGGVYILSKRILSLLTRTEQILPGETQFILYTIGKGHLKICV